MTHRNVTTSGVTLLSVPRKVLAGVLRDCVRELLFTSHEQFGFTPKKSTVDCILVLLSERLREFTQTFTYSGSVIRSSTSCELKSVDDRNEPRAR